MASSKARRRDRLSILDMSMEDDSLLPFSVCTTVNEEEEEDQQQETQGEAPEESKPPTPPPPPRRSKKSGHANLRKSLAWDKAFLTGEGVLEPDELPTAARSPKKLPALPELPTLDINTKLASLPEENESGPELSSMRSYSERFDYRSAASTQNLQLEPSSVKDPAVSGPGVPRILPPKKVIESAIQKGTRLRLPSALTAEQRAAIPLPSKPPKESNLSKKVTLVSRKMKDTLGRVLPGRAECLEKSSDIPASGHIKGESADVDSSCSWDTCSVSDMRESTSDVSSKKEEHCFQRSYSTGSRFKAEDMRTGLRVPSPKLGFFDPRKALQPVRSSSVVSSGAQHPAGKAVRVRPQGLPKPRPRQAPPTSLPVHNPSTSAPTTPRKSINELLSPAARFAVCSSSLTPNSKTGAARGSLKSSRRLGMDAVAEQDKAMEQAGSLVPRFPKLRLGRSDNKSATVEGSESEGKSPLAVNSGLLNSGSNAFKEKGSFFAFARKAVARLSSPVQEKENGGSQDVKMTAAVKTGPVQHSPPNKAAPQPGPWSPVKRHGTAQLGPFDCTKSNVQSVEWEQV